MVDPTERDPTERDLAQPVIQKSSSLPPWVSNNLAAIWITVVAAACLVLLENTHVTASDLEASQGTIMMELVKISRKMDLARIEDKIETYDSELEDLQVYVAEAPDSSLTKAREQNIRRLENKKEKAERKLKILLSEKPR